jgi:hypothetical protein
MCALSRNGIWLETCQNRTPQRVISYGMRQAWYGELPFHQGVMGSIGLVPDRSQYFKYLIQITSGRGRTTCGIGR